jgi:hypothetical protein
LGAAGSATSKGAASLDDLREEGVHRWVIAVAFEDYGERAGSTGGCFFEEFEDGIGDVVKVIVQEPLSAIGCRDKFAARDVNRDDALGGNLANKLEGVVAVIEAVGEDVVKIEEQPAI